MRINSLISGIIMGAIVLLPFVVWDGLYSTTQFPKLIFLVLILLILSFLGFFVSWKFPKKIVYKAIVVIIFFLILFFWNFFYSGERWVSIVGSTERYMGFLTFFFSFLFVFLFFSFGKSYIKWYSLSCTIIGLGVALSIVAIIQRCGIIDNTLVGAMIFEGRAMATIGQYNTLGAFLILPIGFIFLLWKEFRNKTILILILLALFAGIWTTGSRIAMIGGLGLSILLIIDEKWRKYTIFSGGLIGIGILIFLGQYISESGMASLQSRKLLISDAISQIQEFSIPEHLLGRGYESVESSLLREYSPRYLAYEQIDYIPDRVHNIFLDTYMQIGILGSGIFLLIFLIYPFFLVSRGETLHIRNYGWIFLVHFLVISVGFYDIVNLFFGAILLAYIYLSSLKKEDTMKISDGIQYGTLLMVIGLSIGSLYVLTQDAREQHLYMDNQIEQNDLFAVLQDETNLDMLPLGHRDDLIAKILSKYLNTTSESSNTSDILFEKICNRNTYHINQVCLRYAFLKGNFGSLASLIDNQQVFAPNDVIILSLKMELAKHNGDIGQERDIAKKILALFPSFVFQDDSKITEYQKRKKEKIWMHYPLDNWSSR